MWQVEPHSRVEVATVEKLLAMWNEANCKELIQGAKRKFSLSRKIENCG